MCVARKRLPSLAGGVGVADMTAHLARNMMVVSTYGVELSCVMTVGVIRDYACRRMARLWRHPFRTPDDYWYSEEQKIKQRRSICAATGLLTLNLACTLITCWQCRFIELVRNFMFQMLLVVVDKSHCCADTVVADSVLLSLPVTPSAHIHCGAQDYDMSRFSCLCVCHRFVCHWLPALA